MTRRTLVLAGLLLLLPLAAAAQEAPSAESVVDVVDFYYGGDGVVLYQAQICEDVPTEGDNKYGCVGETEPSDVKTDTQYRLRMVYLVPQEQSYDNILVQYNRGGITRATDEVSVSGSIRYRTWKVFSFDEPGDWTIKVLLDQGDAVTPLHEMTVSVSPAESGSSE